MTIKDLNEHVKDFFRDYDIKPDNIRKFLQTSDIDVDLHELCETFISRWEESYSAITRLQDHWESVRSIMETCH